MEAKEIITKIFSEENIKSIKEQLEKSEEPLYPKFDLTKYNVKLVKSSEIEINDIAFFDSGGLLKKGVIKTIGKDGMVIVDELREQHKVLNFNIKFIKKRN